MALQVEAAILAVLWAPGTDTHGGRIMTRTGSIQTRMQAQVPDLRVIVGLAFKLFRSVTGRLANGFHAAVVAASG
jgi:hypothetical protein